MSDHAHDQKKKPAKASSKPAKTKEKPKKPAKALPVNPTFYDARDYVRKSFGRQSQLVGFLSTAARDGLTAFEKRSSEAYNKVDSVGLAMFQIALAAIPAATALSGALHELSSGERALALMASMKKVSHTLEHVHEELEQVESAAEGVEGVMEIDETLESREDA